MTAAQTEILSDQPAYRKTAGERLRRARELKGLSQKDVANALNLMVSHVRAIESNRYDAQAEGEHFGGYLRSYARLVDLDPEQIIELYMSQSESSGADTVVLSPVQSAPQQQSRFSQGISIGFFAVVCLAVVVWVTSRLGIFGGADEQAEIAVIQPNETVVAAERADLAPTINEPEREPPPEKREPSVIFERPATSEKVAQRGSSVETSVATSVATTPEKQARDVAATGSVDRNATGYEQASSISEQREASKPVRRSLASAARQRRERLAATERASSASQATLSNIDIQQRATRTNRQSSRGVDREADRRVQSQTPTLDNKLVSGRDRLVLDFTTDCWVEVYDANGQALRLGVERAGDRLMLRGEAPFDVLVGFSRGVKMTLNGEPVPIKQHQYSDSTQLVVGGPDDYFGTQQTYEDTTVVAANEFDTAADELDYVRKEEIAERRDDGQAFEGQTTNNEGLVERQSSAGDKRVDVPARYSRPVATPAPSTVDELEMAARQINTERDDVQRDDKSPTGSKQDELQFTFSAECWVEVYDVEKRPLVMDTKYAGETLQLKGQGPFEVRVGNSRAVSLKVNGRKIEIKRDRYIGSTEFFVGSR